MMKQSTYVTADEFLNSEDRPKMTSPEQQVVCMAEHKKPSSKFRSDVGMAKNFSSLPTLMLALKTSFGNDTRMQTTQNIPT
jgi:hypothetical protein